MKQVLKKLTRSDYFTKFFEDSNVLTNNPSDYDFWVDRGGFFKQTHTSNSEEDFIQNFGNKLAEVQKKSFLLVLEKDQSKISLKFFIHSKRRRPGVHWFQVKKHVYYLTLNLENGDVFEGSILNYQSKKNCTKRMRKNSFYSKPLTTTLYHILNNIPPTLKTLPDHQKQVSDFVEEMFNNMGIDIKFGFTDKQLIHFYLVKKKIKFPNNFELFYSQFESSPKLKMLRKHKGKMVECIMHQHNFTGDVIKKAIHNLQDKFNPTLFQQLLSAFPHSWVLQNYEFVISSLQCIHSLPYTQIDTLTRLKKYMSEKEYKNLFMCFQCFVSEGTINYSSLLDHMIFYDYLRSVGEKVKWKSQNFLIFKDEHLDWSDKYEHYKRGHYCRIYPDSIDQAFKYPIQYENDIFYPIVLKDSNDYNTESSVQSNCVKTYIGRPSSVIISLRKNSIISEERATIEYQIFKEDGKIKFNRPQSLGKYNSRLDDTWKPILKELDEKMRSWVNSDNFVTPKLEKQLINLNKKMYSDSDWSESGFLFWTYNVVTKDSGSTFIPVENFIPMEFF